MKQLIVPCMHFLLSKMVGFDVRNRPGAYGTSYMRSTSDMRYYSHGLDGILPGHEFGRFLNSIFLLCKLLHSEAHYEYTSRGCNGSD